MATSLYEESASHESVIENFILKSIIQVAKQFYLKMNCINYILVVFQTFYVPLSLKYSCPNPSTWKLAIECLFKVLKKALPIVYKSSNSKLLVNKYFLNDFSIYLT